ncbi:MAG: choice-of-anchor D domain-containing protein [Acidobacteriia bacterium]|nr:choice-of-anchor D domain-containing protein [Terriglobia bacterium]
MRARFSLVWRAAAFAAVSLPLAYGQFELRIVDSTGEHPAPPVAAIASIYPGEAASALFRIRNPSNAPATLDFLEVAGSGFSLEAHPTLPVSLQPQSAVDFTVRFESSAIGSYSAALRSNGISALLTAAVLPRLTYRVDTGSGYRDLAGPVDFGAVERAASATRRFTIENQMEFGMTVPAISVQGVGFALAGVAPAGRLLQPGDTAGFEVEFRPVAAGPYSGSLIVGDRSYPLAGTGQEPPLPSVTLSADLPTSASAQQGAVHVLFDAPARTGGTGRLTLDFLPGPSGVTDPTIAFAQGGRVVPFAFSAGDTEVPAKPFQTGSTAGTLVFTVELGGATYRQSIVIPSAPVQLTLAEAARQANGIEIRITGLDNTRTAGPVVFTFFDAAGNAIAPGSINADASASFRDYFNGSAAGGVFLLKALFPVAGDSSQIAAFEVKLTNSAGTMALPRTRL